MSEENDVTIDVEDLAVVVEDAKAGVSINVDELTVHIEDGVELIVSDIGMRGPRGLPGSGGDLSWRHVQGVAASTWIVLHNLGKYPSISIVDSGGSAVIGEIRYDSLNQCTLTFASAFSGEAYAN